MAWNTELLPGHVGGTDIDCVTCGTVGGTDIDCVTCGTVGGTDIDCVTCGTVGGTDIDCVTCGTVGGTDIDCVTCGTVAWNTELLPGINVLGGWGEGRGGGGGEWWQTVLWAKGRGPEVLETDSSGA